jgi:diguanylate cyclase (GGDEF)-like protein
MLIIMKNPIIDELVKVSFFAEIGKAITSATTLRETFDVVMKQIGEIFAPLNWSLFLRDGKTGNLRFVIVTGSGVEKLKGMVIPKGKGVAGWIAESGQAVIIEDVSRDSRFNPSMDGLTGFVTKSIIGVPLKAKNRVFGVIELVNKLDGGSFTPLELKVLTTIADFTAIAIEKSYYFTALKRIAGTDELTGLANRRSLLKVLDKESERCLRNDAKYAILLIDIDDFKQINDRYGHAAGDGVLRRLAQILLTATRKIDTVCRFGGDEFVVLMPDADEASGLEVKKRINEELGGKLENDAIRFEVSVGVHEGNAKNFDEILQLVDKSMYRDKFTKLEQSYTNLSENLEMFMEEEPLPYQNRSDE